MVIDGSEEALTLSDDRIEKAVRQNHVRLVIIDQVPVSYTHLDVYKRQVLNGFIDMARKEIRTWKLEEVLGVKNQHITETTRGYEADGHTGTW